MTSTPSERLFAANRDAQLKSVASLIGYCESMISAGILPTRVETTLRELLAETLTAHDMPSREEAHANNRQLMEIAR